MVAVLIDELVGIPLLVVEHAAIQEAVGLGFLPNVNVGSDEVVALAELLLRFQFDRLIALGRSQVSQAVQAAILRIRHQQRTQRNRLLVIQRTRHQGGVQVLIKRIRHLLVQLVLILRLQRRVDLVQRLGVLLVADVQEVSPRNHDLAGNLALDIEVKTVVARLLLVLVVPQQRLAAASEIASVTRAQDGQQRVAAGRVGIRDGLLRDAVVRRQSVLVARLSQERRLQESDRLISGDRRQRDVHFIRNQVSRVAEAESGLVVDAVCQAHARLQGQLLRVECARMAGTGELPLAGIVIEVVAHDAGGRRRHVRRSGLHLRHCCVEVQSA